MKHKQAPTAWYTPMSKYNNVKTVEDNITFMSKKEAARYKELKLLEKAGEILELSLQPKFTLQESFKDRKGTHHRAITYKADFRYYDRKFKCVVIEDAKGMKTDVYEIKKKLFINRYPQYIFLET
jgi:hypothetical protein